MNLFQQLQQQAQKRPEQIAIVCGQSGQKLSYKTLLERCLAYSLELEQRGIHQGSRILILKGMSLELYIALLAIFRLGAVAVFIDPSQPAKFIKSCITQTKPDALFAPAKVLALSWLWPIRWRIKISLNAIKTLNNNLVTKDLTNLSLPEATPALMTFTSGSTGRPKVIVRTHQNLNEQLKAITPHIDLQPAQRDLCTMPVFVLANLANGLETHLPASDAKHPGKIEPTLIHKQISQQRLQRIGASPAFLEKMLTTGSAPDSVAAIYTGGAPVLPSLLDRIQHWAPKALAVAIYGSSEAEPICRLNYPDISQQDKNRMQQGSGLLVGRPIDEIDVRIIDIQQGKSLLAITPSQWQQMQRPMEEVGEIVVSGDHVLPGYLHGLGDEENKIDAEGKRWHRTGDAGFFDQRGRLWLSGRCSAIINDAKGRLYPFAVETSAALLVPEVKLSACVSDQQKRYLLVENLADEKVQYLKQHLDWAQLEAVIGVKQLPVDKRHNAKIDYPKLKAKLPELILRRE